MSDERNFMHPDYEPGEFDAVERRLRGALTDEARRVEPHDRLDAILTAASQPGGPHDLGSHRRRWLVPLAAAAAVAVIGGGLWVAGEENRTSPSPAATSPGTVATTPAPSATSPSGTSTGPSSTSTTTAPPAARTVSVPAYFVGPVGDAKPTYKLFREFVPATVTGTGDDATVQAALAAAINAQPFTNTDGYLIPWSGTQVTDVSVAPQLITITLSNAGPQGFGKEVERLAVQELVWTAQAAVGKGTIPVRFAVADGSDALYGAFPTSKTYNRPPTDRSWEDLAPIWVTSPSRGQVLPAAKPVTVTGQATVFEATVQWQLSGAARRSGHAMATIGAPGRGTYSIPLGTLAPGSYTIRVFEPSAKGDGSLVADKSVSFTVR